MIDIGANIGTISLALSQAVGSSGHVYSIEAHPATFSFLEKNLNLNGFDNISLLDMAASDITANVTIESRSADDMNSVNVDNTGIKVKACRLDDCLPINKQYRLLKIDIEGYELLALKGAGKILDNTQIIWFECSNKLSYKFGYTSNELLSYLKNIGFNIFAVDIEKRILNYIDSNSTIEHENLLGCKNIENLNIEYELKS